MRQQRGLDCAMEMQMTQETKVHSQKSVNANKYASVLRVRLHTHTHTDGHRLTFHAKPQGTGPRGLVTRPRHLMGIPLLSKNNQLPHKSNLIFAPEIKLEDNKGITEWERRTKRGTCVYEGPNSV